MSTNTNTESVEALAATLTSVYGIDRIKPCEQAATMLRTLAAERDALRAALDAAQAPREVPRLTEDDIKGTIVPIAADNPTVYLALCYESGPYSITKLRTVAVDLVRAIESRVRELCGVKS